MSRPESSLLSPPPSGTGAPDASSSTSDRYFIQAPDGATFRVEVPKGTPQEDVQNFVISQHQVDPEKARIRAEQAAKYPTAAEQPPASPLRQILSNVVQGAGID